jgi:predicted metal-dependent hydrolase
MNESAPPRLVPDLVLPPYSYVPGHFPHPISDPKGHSFGMKPPRCEPPDPSRWSECRPYLTGIDLFNHGYYWEAHEVWETLWHACRRKGTTADFLKGLIKLAAAAVKVRQGEPRGVQNHARRAAELFTRLGPASKFMGLQVEQLISWAKALAALPAAIVQESELAVPVVCPFELRPGEFDH